MLLGNGFNNSLGIETSYQSIFEKMKEKYPGYKKVEADLGQPDCSIEVLIKNLKNRVSDDDFLPQYIERKIKMDFIHAAYSLVKKQIKKVYPRKNKGIYLLLKNFTNYFTLNYDPFLYLLLMKYKKDDNSNVIVSKQASLFQAEDLNKTHNDLYSRVRKIREKGNLSVADEDGKTQKKLDKCKKTECTTAVKMRLENQDFSSRDIKKAIDIVFEEDKQHPILDVNDGFLSNEFKPKILAMQNLFFLHGAFHIYKNNKLVEKITQSQDKALYERLEEIIDSEEMDIVCVFAGTSKDKTKNIGENEYLREGFEKLSTLTGCLMIFGSSLSKNDRHIYEEINKSKITDIYISSCEKSKDQDYQRSREIFPNKKVILFDYKTVSYKN